MVKSLISPSFGGSKKGQSLLNRDSWQVCKIKQRQKQKQKGLFVSATDHTLIAAYVAIVVSSIPSNFINAHSLHPKPTCNNAH